MKDIANELIRVCYDEANRLANHGSSALEKLVMSQLYDAANAAKKKLEAKACDCQDVRLRLKGHPESRLGGEHGLAAATMTGFETMLTALERIEQIYCDGENTHDDWRTMGELARDALHPGNVKGVATCATSNPQRKD